MVVSTKVGGCCIIAARNCLDTNVCHWPELIIDSDAGVVANFAWRRDIRVVMAYADELAVAADKSLGSEPR